MTSLRYFDLSGRRALVTGASKGIGRAIALGMAEAGADLIISGRDRPALDSLAGEVSALGRSCAIVVADLFEPEAAAQVVAEAFERHGGYQILVNNAGWDIERRALDYAWEEWTRIARFNLETPARFAVESARRFMEAGGGKIISVASIAGIVGVKNDSAYIAAKHGVLGFTKAFALEWARKNVQVNAVAPGLVRTEMTRSTWSHDKGMQWATERTPLGRIGEPDDIVASVLFLAGSGADWITGQVIVVDGGWTTQ